MQSLDLMGTSGGNPMPKFQGSLKFIAFIEQPNFRHERLKFWYLARFKGVPFYIGRWVGVGQLPVKAEKKNHDQYSREEN